MEDLQALMEDDLRSDSFATYFSLVHILSRLCERDVIPSLKAPAGGHLGYPPKRGTLSGPPALRLIVLTLTWINGYSFERSRERLGPCFRQEHDNRALREFRTSNG